MNKTFDKFFWLSFIAFVLGMPGDRYEVNPESWTQLKGSNEKGI